MVQTCVGLLVRRRVDAVERDDERDRQVRLAVVVRLAAAYGGDRAWVERLERRDVPVRELGACRKRREHVAGDARAPAVLGRAQHVVAVQRYLLLRERDGLLARLLADRVGRFGGGGRVRRRAAPARGEAGTRL